jgi:uracil phosphoribosyltransferase
MRSGLVNVMRSAGLFAREVLPAFQTSSIGAVGRRA